MIYLDLSIKKYVDVTDLDRFWFFLKRNDLTTIFVKIFNRSISFLFSRLSIIKRIRASRINSITIENFRFLNIKKIVLFSKIFAFNREQYVRFFIQFFYDLNKTITTRNAQYSQLNE
jgi:hypothetical protein